MKRRGREGGREEGRERGREGGRESQINRVGEDGWGINMKARREFEDGKLCGRT